MKAKLARFAVLGIKWAVKTFGEDVIGAALDALQQEKKGKVSDGPWVKGPK